MPLFLTSLRRQASMTQAEKFRTLLPGDDVEFVQSFG